MNKIDSLLKEIFKDILLQNGQTGQQPDDHLNLVDAFNELVSGYFNGEFLSKGNKFYVFKSFQLNRNYFNLIKKILHLREKNDTSVVNDKSPENIICSTYHLLTETKDISDMYKTDSKTIHISSVDWRQMFASDPDYFKPV